MNTIKRTLLFHSPIFLLAAVLGCTEEKETLPLVLADFTGDRTNVEKGNQVTFTDKSTGNPTAWQWSFEGGEPAVSSEQNPSITYSQAGVYSVSLQASNAENNHLTVKEGFITVYDSVIANFTFDNDTIQIGEAIAFIDESTGGPTAWQWDFSSGNPATSSEQHPTVQYNKPGRYSVLLTVSNDFTKDTTTKHVVVLEKTQEPALQTKLVPLTMHLKGVDYVAIAPDRKTIYYTSVSQDTDTPAYTTDLYTIQSNGSSHKKLLTYDGLIGSLVVSADLSTLAFEGERFSNQTGTIVELLLADANGTWQDTLITYDDGLTPYAFVDQDQNILYNKHVVENSCHCPSVRKISIDGRQDVRFIEELASVTDVSENSQTFLISTFQREVFSVDVDGQVIDEIISNSDFFPIMLSPDGSLVAGSKFHQVKDTTTGEEASLSQFYLINADGTNLRQMTDYLGGGYPLAFTLDGQSVLFSSSMNNINNIKNQEYRELYLMDIDGKNLQRVTNNSVDESAYGYLEDGSKILVSSYQDNVRNLYVLEYP